MARCRAARAARSVGVGRPVLAGEAVDGRGPAGRGGEQGDVERQRQRLADRGGGALLVVLAPAVGEPVPGRLLDLGLGDERHAPRGAARS